MPATDDLTEVILAETREKMGKAVAHAVDDFATVRTGRASPALVEKLLVDYYGAEVPLQQLAGFSVPEARLLVVSPFDKGAMGAIEKAIRNSDLGLNPSNDGHVIRLNFPPLTEERRSELVKRVKHHGRGGQDRRAQPAPGRPPRARGAREATATSPRTSSRGPRRSSTESPTPTKPRSTRLSSTRNTSCSRSSPFACELRLLAPRCQGGHS